MTESKTESRSTSVVRSVFGYRERMGSVKRKGGSVGERGCEVRWSLAWLIRIWLQCQLSTVERYPSPCSHLQLQRNTCHSSYVPDIHREEYLLSTECWAKPCSVTFMLI